MSRRAPMAARSRTFGAGSLIPNPFDPRLILRIAPAVAKAAMASRRRDAADHRLRRLSRSGSNRFVFRSGFIMKPVFAQAQGRSRSA